MSKHRRRLSIADLGPSALQQLREMGIDLNKAKVKVPQAAESHLQKPGGKYHVSPKEERTCDGIVFDSKLELTAYQRLKQLGVPFDRQPVFELQPAFKGPEGATVRAIKYVADFAVKDRDGKTLIIDMKGMLTKEYKLKQKLMAFRGLVIHNIKTLPQLVAFLVQHGCLPSPELVALERAQAEQRTAHFNQIAASAAHLFPK